MRGGMPMAKWCEADTTLRWPYSIIVLLLVGGTSAGLRLRRVLSQVTIYLLCGR